jgi:signal transduction histidine kinase/CheY-like chemotaxis protein
MATDLQLGILAALLLVGLGLVAWQQWRRQRSALARLRDEMRRREAVEEALRRAQKLEAVGRLTRGIAHDFNNHLTVISSNIELLQRRLPAESGSLLRFTESAMAGVQRAATLTQRLLSFSREQPLDPEPVDVGRLVTNATDLLRRTLGEGTTVETALTSGLWQTSIDANQFENVLLNLAVNVRDAMPNGGRLLIETGNVCVDEANVASHANALAGEYVLLAVTGTPAGKATETDAQERTGLELSMVEAFARQSGGFVSIGSSHHRPTTARIYLPRLNKEVAPPITQSIARPRRNEPGGTILVVEDHEEVRRASAEALREMGYQVLEAGDAMDGVRLIVDRGGIDLLFTDIGLPGGVSGRALADAACNAQPGLRVLFTTGYNGEVDQGVHFIAKPFNLAALAAKVSEVMAAPDGAATKAGS